MSQAGVAGLTFADEIETANENAEQLQDAAWRPSWSCCTRAGIRRLAPAPSAGINDCANLQGPIVPIAEGMDDAIDVVISGHTHQPYNCVIDGQGR